MGYFTSKGRWSDTSVETIQTLTAQGTGTVNGTAFEVGDRHTARATLATTAVSGTPTLNSKLQTSQDGTTWVDIPNGAFTQQTAIASQTIAVSALMRFIRSVSVVAGTTPSFTSTITVEFV